jgi:ornithine carbamoyltransferase
MNPMKSNITRSGLGWAWDEDERVLHLLYEDELERGVKLSIPCPLNTPTDEHCVEMVKEVARKVEQRIGGSRLRPITLERYGEEYPVVLQRRTIPS